MTPSGTPSQTVGPFFSIGLSRFDRRFVVPQGTQGAFWIRGRVLDGAGAPVPDALVETWQSDQRGNFPRRDDGGLNGFGGFARCATDPNGVFEIFTVKPGRVPDGAGTLQSPHVDLFVFARGLLEHLVTRMYFPDEDNRSDPLLLSLEGRPRLDTLLAKATEDGYRFDVRLQGEHETIFFAL